MHTITVVGLGPGPRDYLTLGVIRAMEKAKQLILRTGRHGAADYLREKGIPFDTLDCLHERCEDFSAFNQAVVDELLDRAGKSAVVYGVFDPAADETVTALSGRGATIRVMAGVSLTSPLLAAVPDVRMPLRAAEAAGLEARAAQEPLLILEINSRMLAGECKLKLIPLYGEEQEALFFPPSTAVNRKMIRIPLYQLDRQTRYDHTASAMLLPAPLVLRQRYDFIDLIRIMEILRGDNGCPWDKVQTHNTLRQYLIEEAYEASIALEEEDWAHAADELGDVLLQVIFHADIGRKRGTLDLGDITSAICRKMISRHRHIFGEDHCETAEDVVRNWEAIKREERGINTLPERLRDIPRGLPPLMRAFKALARVYSDDRSSIGLGNALDEAARACAQLRAGGGAAGEQAMGDLLFACVEVARQLNIQPETALASACEAFIARYSGEGQPSAV
jgi:tetrapyrrole methylase family protein / MazG family protein